MKICICGGGSLGHIIAGKAAHQGHDVAILTRKPEEWSNTLIIDDCRGNIFRGNVSCVSANPQTIIPGCDIVMLCLPGFAIENVLNTIRPHLSENTYVGSVVCSTGFFFMAHKVLGANAHLFGFQRSPYIARTDMYGRSAHLLGYKNMLHVASKGIDQKEELCQTLSSLLDTPTQHLDHWLEASLTNSNPLLHPARLYGLFHNWSKSTPFLEIPGFYDAWDSLSSETLIACDEEFQNVLNHIPVQLTPIPRLLDYYESTSAETLTQKLRSIPAFIGIKAPMKQTEEGFEPDFENRYFTEDFPYGMVIVKSVAEAVGCSTPTIDRVLAWGSKMMNKEYIHEGKLTGKDLAQSGYISPALFHEMLCL